MPGTCQPSRSLDECSEHDRVPGAPTPGSLAAGLPSPRKPAALPHRPCSIAELQAPTHKRSDPVRSRRFLAGCDDDAAIKYAEHP
jgi:hypothetical protein